MKIKFHWGLCLIGLIWLSIPAFIIWHDKPQTALRMALLLCCINMVSILCHECGHCLVGSFVGIKDGTIVVSSLFGFWLIDNDQFGRIGPWRRILVIAAGPAANLALAGAITIGFYFLPLPYLWKFEIYPVIGMAIGVNLMMSILNLIPVYPFDGHRILSELAMILHVPRRLACPGLQAASAIGGMSVLGYLAWRGIWWDAFCWLIFIVISLYLTKLKEQCQPISS